MKQYVRSFASWALSANAGSRSSYTSLVLLCFRLLFGGFLLYHGIDKVVHFDAIAPHFPDPYFIGSEASFILVIFAELGCSAAVILGLFTRLAALPVMFAMFTAAMVYDPHAAYATHELAYVYLAGFTLLFLLGGGRYGIDGMLWSAIQRRPSQR